MCISFSSQGSLRPGVLLVRPNCLRAGVRVCVGVLLCVRVCVDGPLPVLLTGFVDRDFGGFFVGVVFWAVPFGLPPVSFVLTVVEKGDSVASVEPDCPVKFGRPPVFVSTPLSAVCVFTPFVGVCIFEPVEGIRVFESVEGVRVFEPVDGIRVFEPAEGVGLTFWVGGREGVLVGRREGLVELVFSGREELKVSNTWTSCSNACSAETSAFAFEFLAPLEVRGADDPLRC